MTGQRVTDLAKLQVLVVDQQGGLGSLLLCSTPATTPEPVVQVLQATAVDGCIVLKEDKRS